MLSVVIPVYNEEKALVNNSHFFDQLAQSTEIIFVDGGSKDQTVSLVKKFGKVVCSQKGRALQMNEGARQATSETILFLHADSYFPLEVLGQIEEAILEKGYIGGCLEQVYDSPDLIYKWIAFTGNVRAKLSRVFYGDQCIFVRKDIFTQLGGFPNTEICEDVLFTRKLRREGKVGVLSAPVYCSTRRWKVQGIRKTFFQNMRINMALALNDDLNKLADDYQDVRN